MEVALLVGKALAGIEAGKLEVKPGLSNVLKIMSRIAPQIMLKQMVKMSQPQQIAPQT